MMTAEAPASAVKLPAGVIEAHATAKAASEAITAHYAAMEQEPWAHDLAAWGDEHDRLTRIEYSALAGLLGAVGFYVGVNA